ncbi:MAG TPA: hypothetical protein VMS17_06360 [Gemmataceae bacterium]|nr:hypothetical protein [Gemmataceae bacterium]
MIFPYVVRPVTRPIPSMKGAKVRHLPIVSAGAIHAGVTYPIDGLVDSAASDVIFPLLAARRLGIDLTKAPVGESRQAGGVWLRYRYASVRMHLSNGRETCQWDAIVGFLDVPTKHALLGQAGFLQFFDAFLYGARREVEIIPNAAFAGAHTIH